MNARSTVAATRGLILNQSTVIAGGLALAFVIWLAINNRFGVYYAILIGPGASAGAGGGASLDPTSPNFNPAQAGVDAGKAVRDWITRFFGGTP